MTSHWRGIGLALALAGLTQVGAAAIQSTQATRPAKTAAAPAKKLSQVTPRPARAIAAPAYIRDQVTNLGKGFNGLVGIAVRSVDDEAAPRPAPVRRAAPRGMPSPWGNRAVTARHIRVGR